MKIWTLRGCLNAVNKEFGLSAGKGSIIALWNIRQLRKFDTTELNELYYNIADELRVAKDKDYIRLLNKLKTKLVKITIDDAFKTKGM